jgi:hypothetical protein
MKGKLREQSLVPGIGGHRGHSFMPMRPTRCRGLDGWQGLELSAGGRYLPGIAWLTSCGKRGKGSADRDQDPVAADNEKTAIRGYNCR